MQVNEFEIVLPAGAVIERAASGYAVRCTASTAPFKIAFENGQGGITFEKGLSVRANEAFSRFTLMNNTDAEITATLVVSDSDLTDDRLNITGGGLMLESKPKNGDVRVYEVNGEMEVADYNPKRRSIRFQNLSASSIVLNSGIWLRSLDSFETNATDAFSALEVGNNRGRLVVFEVSE
ncbi:hypothetical protein [Polycladidibacter hongkongensis]|uniref:hypothetical protein n=1 Tax=Polycladidibacter hongkongensis TaxID=1647556 RepID=UPI00082B7226|nr:hypothetical protein [Pseudovibrio hongkongensis]